MNTHTCERRAARAHHAEAHEHVFVTNLLEGVTNRRSMGYPLFEQAYF